ncbi:MAG: DUF4058 family protein [Chloroflexota bacterium]|nr:DUF4058 family protein [Chloroflexota bacterium]
MISPFPGMDPYLEDRRLWPSVHHRLISSISDMITMQVAPHFYVTIEERVYITSPDEDDETSFVPDVYLMQPPFPELATVVAAGHQLTAPTTVQILEPLELRDRYIEVRDTSGQEVVTTIEVISPRNKAINSKGRRAFLAKRRTVMGASTNWIEIDLLRGGRRPDEVAGQSDYYALLKRRGHADQLDVWFIDLRDPLPVIAVPLRPPFPDALLDLGVAIADVYARGTYAARLDYSHSVPPPTPHPADAAWVAERARQWRAARQEQAAE